MELDRKDKLLLIELQKNCRASLTDLAKALNLSIDSTHKRLKKLQDNKVIYPSLFIDPKTLGYELVVNVQIKLQNITEEDLNKFLHFLKEHPNVIELISILGEYDLTCVIIAKNTSDYDATARTIRQKFKHLIADWRSVINLQVHKFEEYDVLRL